MKQATGIDTEALCEKYLGLPTVVGHTTMEARVRNYLVGQQRKS